MFERWLMRKTTVASGAMAASPFSSEYPRRTR